MNLDWESIAKALLMKYGGERGQAVVGSGTLAWAKSNVALQVELDGDALVLRWRAPSLKPGGV